MFWTFWTASKIFYLIDSDYYLSLNENSRSSDAVYTEGDIL